MKAAPLFVGWDVAGWKCPTTSTGTRGPRDALVLLTGGPALTLTASSAWTNFKNDILKGIDFVAALVAKQVGGAAPFFLAIDAPLGWPDAFTQLLTGAWTPPKQAAGYDDILRRAADKAFGGQSAVGQRLGSASSKALAYLAGCKYVRRSAGVFDGPSGQTAIETYPAAVRRSGRLTALHAQLSPTLPPNNKDFSDALWCALAAATFAGSVPGLNVPSPPQGISASEGWIWTP